MWTLLKSAADWAQYRADVGVQSGLGHGLSWGRGPAEYPCLVASIHEPGSCRMHVAYVYRGDAGALLDQPAPPVAAPASRAAVERRAYDRSLAAGLLTLTELAIDTGLCRQEQFEQRWTANLAKVDQWSAEDHDPFATAVRGGKAGNAD